MINPLSYNEEEDIKRQFARPLVPQAAGLPAISDSDVRNKINQMAAQELFAKNTQSQVTDANQPSQQVTPSVEPKAPVVDVQSDSNSLLPMPPGTGRGLAESEDGLEPPDINAVPAPEKIAVEPVKPVGALEMIQQRKAARAESSKTKGITSEDLKEAMKEDNERQSLAGMMEGAAQIGHGLARDPSKFDNSYYQSMNKEGDKRVDQVIKANAANLNQQYRDSMMDYKAAALMQGEKRLGIMDRIAGSREGQVDVARDRFLKTLGDRWTDDRVIVNAVNLRDRAAVGLETLLGTKEDKTLFPQVLHELSVDVANVLQGKGQVAVETIRGVNFTNLDVVLQSWSNYFADSPQDIDNPKMAAAIGHILKRLRDNWEVVAKRRADAIPIQSYSTPGADKAQKKAKEDVLKREKSEKWKFIENGWLTWGKQALATGMSKGKPLTPKQRAKALLYKKTYEEYYPLMHEPTKD